MQRGRHALRGVGALPPRGPSHLGTHVARWCSCGGEGGERGSELVAQLDAEEGKGGGGGYVGQVEGWQGEPVGGSESWPCLAWSTQFNEPRSYLPRNQKQCNAGWGRQASRGGLQQGSRGGEQQRRRATREPGSWGGRQQGRQAAREAVAGSRAPRSVATAATFAPTARVRAAKPGATKPLTGACWTSMFAPVPCSPAACPSVRPLSVHQLLLACECACCSATRQSRPCLLSLPFALKPILVHAAILPAPPPRTCRTRGTDLRPPPSTLTSASLLPPLLPAAAGSAPCSPQNPKPSSCLLLAICLPSACHLLAICLPSACHLLAICLPWVSTLALPPMRVGPLMLPSFAAALS